MRNGSGDSRKDIEPSPVLYTNGSSKPPVVNLYGGTITGGNTGNAGNGAVYLVYGTLNILGNVEIADNVKTGTSTLANVYITASMTFKLSGSSGANVGISSATKDAKIGTVSADTDGNGLFSDDKAYTVCIVGTDVQLTAAD